MAQRIEAQDSRDDFPTPPWATRALLSHVLGEFGPFDVQSVLEPDFVGKAVKASLVRGGALTDLSITIGERQARTD